MEIANTPSPPYFAVIFTSVKKKDDGGYEEMAELMVNLVKRQPGFLGFESVRDGLGITISYWQDLVSIQRWKEQVDHRLAQKLGKERWYEGYKVRICKVEREYEHP